MAETDMDDLIEIIEKEGNLDDIPMTLPMMPVRDVVIFTDMLLPLFVGREKSIKAVEESLASDRYLFLSAQKIKKGVRCCCIRCSKQSPSQKHCARCP